MQKNAQTTAQLHSSHMLVMLKILQARLQQYVNCELPDVGDLISGSSAFSKTSLNIWKFTVRILLKPRLENFEHY